MSTEYLLTPIEAQLDGLFGQYTAANQAKGLVYGLVGPDGLMHSRGFGVADDDDTPPDLDTVFPIASMTKSFVACAALLARDRGLVNLDASITDYFPELSTTGASDEPSEPPTIRMLLSMAGGLTEDNSWVDPFVGTPVDELLDRVANGLSYSNEPGAVFEYSNLGYALAGLAVGKAVGCPIEDWVHDELLTPLRLNSTRFDSRPLPDGQARATGYSLDPNGEWVSYQPAQSDAFAASAGIQSTVRDLARWIAWLGKAFRSAGDDPAEQLVGRTSRREMQRLHQLDLPALAARPDGGWRMAVGGYGLGLRITEHLHRGTIVSHSGGLPGFALDMIWHPDSGYGVVALTNSHRGNPSALAEEALFRVLDREQVPARTMRLWPATLEFRQVADQLIRGWDDDLAARAFAENIDFDRPITERRTEIQRLVDEIGPLDPPRPVADVLSAATPADITWAIPGQRGELICMVHLTPVRPPRIQEFEVRAVSFDRPRSARVTDISPRRAAMSPASLSSLPNTRVILPNPL